MSKPHAPPTPGVVILCVEGTIPADATIVTDEHGNACVAFPDGRIFEPFLGWSMTMRKLPVHGDRPTAILPDTGDDVCGPVPEPGALSPVVGTRPVGFTFNDYRVQQVTFLPAGLSPVIKE